MNATLIELCETGQEAKALRYALANLLEACPHNDQTWRAREDAHQLLHGLTVLKGGRIERIARPFLTES